MKGVYSSDTEESTAEATGNSAGEKNARMQECLYCKEPHKKICGEYKMEAIIQHKMKLDKCDAYTTKETLGYRGRKSYVSATRRTAKREEKQRGIEEETNLQANYWNLSIIRRHQPMQKQNRK